jgi:hypothetical protein
MIQHAILWCLIIISVSFLQIATAQTEQPRRDPGESHLESVDEQVDSGVEYSRVAQFKSASRKLVYHADDFINIDFAMLNTSDAPVFFKDLSYAELNVVSNEDEKHLVTGYVALDIRPSLKSYNLIQPGEFIRGSYPLLARCDDRHYFRYTFDKGTDYKTIERRIFEENLFLNFGQGCIRASAPGTYIFKAKQSNRAVVVGPGVNFKTAVGEITSTPITITIVD